MSIVSEALRNEPVARYGTFVMNAQAEIRQAIEDYRLGRMGAINS
jgi:redox-sensitive bicupin YhaK (pirin superfamily)